MFRIVLILLFVLSLLGSLGLSLVATSALLQIMVGISYLITTVLFVSIGILSALKAIENKITPRE